MIENMKNLECETSLTLRKKMTLSLMHKLLICHWILCIWQLFYEGKFKPIEKGRYHLPYSYFYIFYRKRIHLASNQDQYNVVGDFKYLP